MLDGKEKSARKSQKPRSPWDKEGSFRYLQRKLNMIRKEMREGFKRQEARMRVLTNTLQPFMEIEESYILSVVCQDEADEALLDYLRRKAAHGITPTEACSERELARFRFKPYHITRRIQRMNKRLRDELGKPVAESYSRRWFITDFVLRAWADTKEEVTENMNG